MVRFLCTVVFALIVLSTVSSVAKEQNKSVVGPSPEERVARQEIGVVDSGPRPDTPLAISLSDYDFPQHPGLLQRILSSPHGYFRFINRPFALAVCRHFESEMIILGNVNLHGDAHLENYSVTDRQRGLADFDDASAGPFVLDLVRFGVSIHLASRALGISEQADAVVASFIEGYQEGLRNRHLTMPEPALVAHIRAGFPKGRQKLLTNAEALMQPIDKSGREFERAYQQYEEQMKEANPYLPSGFFDIKKLGSLKLGIGSAFNEKYLMRVEGHTREPDDDLIVEAKEIGDLEGVGCVQHPRQGGIMQIAASQARLSFEPPRYAGYVILHPYLGFPGRRAKFWVYAWDDNYFELSIPGSIRTPQDLFDISRDVGIQLGRGHLKSIIDPYETAARQGYLSLVSYYQDDITTAIRELTRQTIAAWEWVREEAANQGSTQPSTPENKSIKE